MPRVIALIVLLPVAATAVSVGDRLIGSIWKQRSFPLNVSAAESQGWVRLNDGCDALYGHRYRKGARLTPTLLFSERGHVAGFQIVVNQTTFPLYPHTNLRSPGVFEVNGNPEDTALSLYLTDPADICNASSSEPVQGSVGDRLWVRTGVSSNSPPDFEDIPLTEDDMAASAPFSKFVAGGCAPTSFAYPGSPGMGRHYWRYLGTPNCTDSGPIFLLYDNNKLGGVGFSFVGTDMAIPTVGGVRPEPVNGFLAMTDREMDSLWEFARQPLDPYFFSSDQNPKCLRHLNTFDDLVAGGDITTGTLHIFFSDPQEKTCDYVPPTQTMQSGSVVFATPIAVLGHLAIVFVVFCSFGP